MCDIYNEYFSHVVEVVLLSVIETSRSHSAKLQRMLLHSVAQRKEEMHMIEQADRAFQF